MPCQHEQLLVEPSVHPLSEGFREMHKWRKSSKKPSSWKGLREDVSPNTFPAPLVLPYDELSWDPKYEPQSYLSWIREAERNPVTPERRTIYVATVQNAEFMLDWAHPSIPASTSPVVRRDLISGLQNPDLHDVIDYLGAFYHGMPVKPFQAPLTFTTWSDSSKPSRRKGAHMKSVSPPIGLQTSTEVIRIRTRPSLDGVYAHQLNLLDLLDVCISIVPDDAYALLMLIEQDMYEDEEDDFCCGRAAGGSRVAVVSMARYNPLLDAAQEINREHEWPASHCAKYVNVVVREAGYRAKHSVKGKSKGKKRKRTDSTSPKSLVSPVRAAVHAATDLLFDATSPSGLQALWVGRICRTASHEVGHCIGLDHCVFYACIMQGTASIKEDARQPPYLCPVDLAKVLRATGAEEGERARALLRWCERWEGVQGGAMWVGYAAWLRAVVREREEKEMGLVDLRVKKLKEDA